jgi:hypothetical protein
MTVEDIVAYAKSNNMPVAALTDYHSLSALPDFLKSCYENGIHGIAGLTIQILDNKKPLGDMVLLGKGGKGFASLRKILDVVGYVGLDNKFNEQRGVELSDILAGKLKGYFENCIMLDGAPGSIGEALIKKSGIDNDVQAVKTMANDEQSPLGNIKSQFMEGDYLGVQTPAAKSVLAHAIALPSPTDADDTTKRLNILESTLGYARDGEQMARTMQWFKGYANEFLERLGKPSQINAMIKAKFSGSTLSASGKPYEPSDPPFIGAEYLISKCPVPRIFKMKPESLPIKNSGEKIILKTAVKEAWGEFAKTLPPGDVEEYRNRLLAELSTIGNCGFEDYFVNIIMIKNLAQSYKNDVMLRGSAVASLVMHVLKLTPIDPIKEKLLFARFLNEDRIEDPDVDIEFTDPEGMRQALERDFGPGQMAYLSSDDGVSKPEVLFEMARDAMLNFYPMTEKRVKEVESSLDRLTANKDFKKFKNMEKWKEQFDLEFPSDKRSGTMNKLISIANEYNTAGLGSSISPGSVVFIPDGVGRYFSLLRGQKNKLIENDAPRIALTKHNLLSTGHIKYDFLTNKGFTRAMHVWNTLGLPKDMKLDLEDPAIAFVFNRGGFMGVNQVSGGVGARMARDFKPRNFNEITAINALIRDGGDNTTIKQYLHLKNNPEQVNLAPAVDAILGETYGSMLYEEQLMLMLTDVGGFTWNEADTFRSSLKKGKGGVIDDYESRFITHASKQFNVSPEEASKWYQPFREKRGKFVFNKAHAVAYAHVAVRQCWLKAHYPAYYAAELFSDDKLKFEGKPLKLEGVVGDWKKLFPQVGKGGQNAKDFIKNVAEILLREESNINSKYKRKPLSLQSEIDANIKAGGFDFALPAEWSRGVLQQYSDSVFKRLNERGYNPEEHGKIKQKGPSGSSPVKVKAGQAVAENALNNGAVIVNAQKYEEGEGDVLPANKRTGLIDWDEKVMIGYLLAFFKDEGVINSLSVDTKTKGLDRHKFIVEDKDGKKHKFHIASASTDSANNSERNSKHSLASGLHQGGVGDKTGTNSLEVAMTIAKLTGYGDLKFPYIESARRPGAYYLPKEHKKRFENALSSVIRKSDYPLHDTLSGKILNTFTPSRATSPVLLDVTQKTLERGMKKLKELFQDSRYINIEKMRAQFTNGNFSIAEVFSDKLLPDYSGDGLRRSKFTEILANYQKVDDVTPVYQLPTIVNNMISPGGHQRFMMDKDKGYASKLDLGFTTKRIRGHICGRIQPGSDTFWLGEAALDILSFNELQGDIHDLNKRRGMTLPFAEPNSAAVRSAGGATDVISDMLNVNIIVSKKDKGKFPLEVDFQRVKRHDTFGEFTELQVETAGAWFKSQTIHFLKQNTPENNEAQKQLAAIMKNFSLPDEEIKKVVKVHDYNPNMSFNQNVSKVYKLIKKEDEFFLHDSNMKTWVRGSDLLVKPKDDGGYDVGLHIKIEEPIGPKFSEMDTDQKAEVMAELRSRFEYMTGARSIGVALDNDGAGLVDADRVALFCDLIGVPVGRLMPKEEIDVPFVIGGKNTLVKLKDHNDYLMLRRRLQNDGQMDVADKLLVKYAGALELPKLDIDEPQLSNRPKLNM